MPSIIIELNKYDRQRRKSVLMLNRVNEMCIRGIVCVSHRVRIRFDHVQPRLVYRSCSIRSFIPFPREIRTTRSPQTIAPKTRSSGRVGAGEGSEGGESTG